jgi:hypothetical protein
MADTVFLMSSVRLIAEPWRMLSAEILAAGGSGYGNFIAGFLIGAGISFLLGPAVRSWLAYKEWADASRQAHLTDELLARMQQDDEGPGRPNDSHSVAPSAPSRNHRLPGSTDRDETAEPRGPWPASH